MISTSLLNLPTELLQAVLYELDPEDVLNLGKACRRLNLIAVPFFLTEMGLTDPESSCIVKASSGRRTDELAALAIYFPLSVFSHFYCIISHRHDLQETFIPPSHISWLIGNIRRVTNLLSRISSVKSFSLIIDSWGSGWSLRSDVVRDFITSVLELAETAIRKSCTSLQILHFHPASVETNYYFELSEAPMAPKLMKSIQLMTNRILRGRAKEDRTFVGHGWRYRKEPSLDSMHLTIPRISQSRLTHFDLNSEFLLVPPFSAWTFNILKSSPIRTLSISLPSSITKEEFSLYHLPRIAESVPKLQEIRWAFHHDDFSKTVVEILHLFPLLRKITFGLSFFAESTTTPPPPSTSTTKRTKLLYLSSFTGSPDQAAYFLRSSILCPSLESLNLISDTYYQSHAFQTDYSTLATQLDSINNSILEMGIKPCISLCLASQGVVPDGLALPVPDGLSNYFQHFSTVSRLTLDGYPQRLHEDYDITSRQLLIDYALAWLNAFRGLRSLTLAVKCNSQIDHLSESVILSAINDQYPELISVNIVSLTINPKKYHYHWSNAHDDWERGTDDIPTTPSYEKKSRGCYVCSEF